MAAVFLAFDRGSVVVKGLSREEDLSFIPEVVWDARLSAYRGPARVFYALAAELRRRCLPVVDQPLPRLHHPAHQQTPQLHPHQRAALGAWRLARGRAVLALPRGSARMDLALAAIAATGTPALVLVRGQPQAQQWTTALRRQGFMTQAPDQLGPILGSSAPATVATFADAHRDVWRLGDRFGLVLVDEVEGCGRGFPDEVLEMCTAPLRLGFTDQHLPAGPVGERIQTLVGPEVYALLAAEETGDFQPPFHRIVWRLERDQGDRRGGVRRCLLPRSQQHALALLLDYHRGQRTVVVAPDHGTARALARAQLLPVLDAVAPDEQRATLEAFRAGRLPAMVVVRGQELRAEHELPAAEVGILVGDGAGDPGVGREVGCSLRPARGTRALVYQLAVADTEGAAPAMISAA